LNVNINKERIKNLVQTFCNFEHRSSIIEGGLPANQWLYRQIQEILIKLPIERRRLFNLTLGTVENFKVSNIILKINGKIKNESVIIGAHQDDIGMTKAGANDNAGISTIL
jgi:hypothetical protein